MLRNVGPLPTAAILVALGFGVAPARAGEDAPAPVAADIQTILHEVKRPGAAAVVLNVWATWCEPCRKEMPGLLRFYRAHAKEGLRLVLVSADDEADRNAANRFLESQGVDFPTWIKRDSDMVFINAIDEEWIGNLPATFVFDGKGVLHDRIYAETDEAALEAALQRLSLKKKAPRKGRQP
jgi:thiol-disulfide isomerase/thioredoxin